MATSLAGFSDGVTHAGGYSRSRRCRPPRPSQCGFFEKRLTDNGLPPSTHVRFCQNADYYKIAKWGINSVRDRRRIQQTAAELRHRVGCTTVMFVIRSDEMIRLEDAIRRAELSLL